MKTDIDCIKACCDTYFNPTAFDKWFDGSTTDEVVFGVQVFSDCSLIALRGSLTFLDWMRDFCARMVQTADIGGVEQGFYIGMRMAQAEVMRLIDKTKPVYVTGHSLGGGRANILAALLIQSGYSVIVVTFGSPRPGDAVLKEIVSRYPNKAYKNGPDYVTDVPIPIHPLLPYESPSLWISVFAEPAADDDWGLLAWHHCELYQKALANVNTGFGVIH